MTYLLVVDDDELMSSAVQRILEDAGYTARALTRGQAALEAIQTAPPDLIISDVRMPDMDGPHLLKAARTCPNCQDIPFLFMSGSITLQAEGQLEALDNVTYLRKPFKVDAFLETVATLLHADTALGNTE